MDEFHSAKAVLTDFEFVEPNLEHEEIFRFNRRFLHFERIFSKF